MNYLFIIYILLSSFNIYQMMINGFDNFILESYIMESVLYFSPRLRSQLKSISDENEIAKELLGKEKSDIKPDITLVDLDESDFGYLTFIPMKNALKKLKEYYPNAKNVDIQNDVDTGVSDHLWVNRNIDNVAPVYSKGRNSIKAGKLVNKIFGDKYNSNEIEKFVNLIRSTRVELREKLELVEGDYIPYWYDSYNYYDNKGTLGTSCMKNMSKKTFNIYVENPESVKLLILTIDGKLLGRALVWKLDSIKSKDERKLGRISTEYFMDRVYYTDEYHLNKFIKYAKEKGWCYRKNQTYSDTDIVQLKDIKYDGIKMTVKIKPKNYLQYPYMDTFGRYDERSGTLYNDTNKSLGGHILRRIDGSYERSIHRARAVINRFADFTTQMYVRATS